MNKRTVALTTEQYKEIISTMKQGFTGCRPNPRAATALMLEANLGLRISDIVQLRLCDIVKDGNRYRLAIIEQKTGKHYRLCNCRQKLFYWKLPRIVQWVICFPNKVQRRYIID